MYLYLCGPTWSNRTDATVDLVMGRCQHCFLSAGCLGHSGPDLYTKGGCTRIASFRQLPLLILYTEGLKDRRNYTNLSNRRCKFSISPTRCSDRRYSCCKSSVSRGFKRFLKTDLMTIFYSSPRKNCKKPREKSIFYSLSIRGVAEVALNQCS